MNRITRFKIIVGFVVLTIFLTVIVVYAWEQVLMVPLYRHVERLYPGDQYETYRWRLAQRFEHFWISIIVDLVVVTLLLRLVDRQQEKLRMSEERYRALFEHAGDGIGVIAAADHRLVDVNRKFAEILGYTPDALIGRHICELVRATDAAAEEACTLSSSGSFGQAGAMPAWMLEKEVMLESASGGSVPTSASCSAIATGKEKLYIFIIRDLTERKRLEAEREAMQRQLFQSSKLASLGELSAGVAHEINNPLNCVINFAQLLKDDGAARDDSQRYMIDGIIEEGERMAGIVRNLLTFARQDPHMPTRLEVGPILHNAVALFGHQLEKDGIEVEVEADSGTSPVLADASRLRQVVVNMISNAHQALNARPGDGKRLAIRAHNVELEGQPAVRIEFFDNGAGIARENLDKVFDPFFTTKRDSGGTGLGLSLSFGIIRDYGGRIHVESEEGRFTRFLVDLPAALVGEENYAHGVAG